MSRRLINNHEDDDDNDDSLSLHSAATEAEADTSFHPRKPDWRLFDWWHVDASVADVFNVDELLAREPGHQPNARFDPRDLGFTDEWSGGEHDETYPACAFLVLGFFCFLPWCVGACYVRAASPTARIAGILSGVLSVMFVSVLAIAFLSSSSLPFSMDAAADATAT